MSLCWFCYWGWATEIEAIYKDAESRMSDPGMLKFGPSHIVWSDENFGDAPVDFCLLECDKYADEMSEDDLRILRESLEALKRIDILFRTPPSDYDGKHPENFPPPQGYFKAS